MTSSFCTDEGIESAAGGFCPLVVWAIPAVWQGGPQPQALYPPLSKPSISLFGVFLSLGSVHLDIWKPVTCRVFKLLFFFLNEKDESLRYCKEEDSLLGIASNSFLWGRPAVEAEWGGFTEVVTRSGFGPNIVEKCSEETQST